MKPIALKTSPAPPKNNRNFEMVKFAIKSSSPTFNFVFEMAILLISLISLSSCLSMTIQWNKCLNRLNANYSFECLNTVKTVVRDPYIGGAVVGIVLFGLATVYNQFKWKVFNLYASQFTAAES